MTGFSSLGNPTISDGVLYFSAFSGNTYAFGLLSGTNAVRAPAPASLRPDMKLVARR